MKKSPASFGAIAISLVLGIIAPPQALASYPDLPQGSGTPFTRIIPGQQPVEACPSGFQHATGLIVDLSWPAGQREFTECWPEQAFVANRIGGEIWEKFVSSGGTYDPTADKVAEQAYYEAVAAAQASAERESKEWNAANPGQQKCVQWGPIIGPNGQQSSGGVCANPVPVSEPSAGSTDSETVTAPSSSPSGAVSPETTSQPSATQPVPGVTPEPIPAPPSLEPLADGTYERICKVLGWINCAEWRVKNSQGAEVNRVVGPHPESELAAICGSGLCGGGVGGTVELIRMVVPMPPVAPPNIPAPEVAPGASPTISPSTNSGSSPSPERPPAPSPAPAPAPAPAPEPNPVTTPKSQLGGYAVINPQSGVVCGVIVATEPQILGFEYMGCPPGSQSVFQTFPSETGNVAGYHGPDVIYRSGTFYLSWGTITNGIATDSNGRVWETGTNRVLSPGTTPRPTPDTSSRSASASSESSMPGNRPTRPDVVSSSPAIGSSSPTSTTSSPSDSSVAPGVGPSRSPSSQPITSSPDSTPEPTRSPSTSPAVGPGASASPNLESSSSDQASPETAEPPPASESNAAEISNPAPAPQIVIGSFQGRWAVRLVNLEGYTVSIRAGGNWFKFDVSESRVLLSRRSIAGADLSIAIWINGALTVQENLRVVS